MFERVELDNQKKMPTPINQEEPALEVENSENSIPVSINNKQASSLEIPAPPPQKANLSKIPGRKKIWLITSIIAGVILVGAGGVFAAYKQGYIDIPFLNTIFLNDDVLASATEKLTDIQSGEITTTFSLAVEDKTDKAVVLEGSSGEAFGPREKSQAAQMKSDIGGLRTALVLYADDNNAIYPNDINDLVGPYLAYEITPRSDTITYKYKTSNNNEEYTLIGTMTLDGATYTYSLDHQGRVSDNFPQTSTSSYMDADDFYSEFAEGIPTDMLIEGSFYTFAGKQKNETGDRDVQFSLAGKYSTSGTTFEADVEFINKDSVSYFRINNFPSLFFFDLSAITGQWIEMPSDINDLESNAYLNMFDVGEITDTTSEASDEIRTVTTILIQQLIKQGFISVERKLPTERLDGKLFDKYELGLDVNKFDEVLVAMQGDLIDYCASNQCEYINPDDLDLDDLQIELDQLIGGENGIIAQLFNAGEYILWIDRDGNGYKLDANLYLGFPEDSVKLSDKQIRLSIAVGINNINKEPNVEKPKDPINWKEAERILAGLTEEQWKYQEQTKAVGEIRSALDGYYATSDEFPESLNELLKPAPENEATDSARRIIKLAQVTIDPLPTTIIEDELTIDDWDSINPFLSNPDYYLLDEIPLDLYSSKPFVYTKEDDNYTLVYDLAVADEPDNSYGNLFSNYTLYADGKNTADKYVVSKEAIWDIDSDDDGLTGQEEYEYGTDPTMKDTDSDLTSDFDEIQAGTDPLDKNSKPGASTTITTPIILQAPVVVGSLSPNTGDANGGTTITIGVTGASNESAIYFGERRAYILSTTDSTARVVLPGYSEILTTGDRVVVNVRVVTSGIEGELLNGFTYTGSLLVDSDGDGLPDNEETSIGTSSTLTDSDQDGTNDYDEVQAGRNPLSINDKDSDGDGLSDKEEALYGTDPNKRDTDSDGYMDKNEIDAGYNPLSASPVKSHGMRIDDNDWMRGADDAPVTVVVFSDFECPFCKSLYDNTLTTLLVDYPDSVRIVYKHLPLSFHANAQKASEAAECAGKQGKFWEMHDALFDNSDVSVTASKNIALNLSLDTTVFDACLDNSETETLVKEDVDYSQLLNISGTPVSYINGDIISGNQPYATFKAAVDQILGIGG